MAKAYSNDIRKLVIDKKKQGLKTRQIMQELNVSESFITKVMKNYTLTKQVASTKKKVGRKRKFDEKQLEAIKNSITTQPDITLEEINEQLGLNVAISTLHYTIKNYLKFVYKKKHYFPRINNEKML